MCLNLATGNFNLLTWQTGNFNAGQVTITWTATSISIQRVGFAAALNLNGNFKWVVFGPQQFIAILAIDAGGTTRTVFIVKAIGGTLSTEQVHLQNGVSNAVALPVISSSPGNPTLFFVWSGTGTVSETNTLSIVRSDNGATILVALGPISGLTQVPFAEITATQLIIHHASTFTTTTTSPWPAGVLTVTQPLTPFGQAVIGASNPALGTITRTFTLGNSGLDCVTITAIADNAPFSLTPASRALLPITIEPGATRPIDIVFAPTAVGPVSRTLNVTAPGGGATGIACSGSARLAVASIGTSVAALNFGTRPHPTTVTAPPPPPGPLTIINTGEIDVTVSVAAAPAGSAFTWTTAAGAALPVGGAAIPISVTFVTEGDFASAAQVINVVPSQGAPRQVTLNGAGCVANSVIGVPAIIPLDYARIERGFRTVRFIEITNLGDGDLSFRAQITAGANPAQAAQFGLVLPNNDITDAPASRLYAVLPATRCGPGATGPNVVQIAVSFFADGASGTYSANLVIDQHNATNFPAAQTWTFPLSAEVIDPVPIDAALVIDKSGSMNQTIGARKKMEAARTGAALFVEMLRDAADDRAAVISFDTSPAVVQGMLAVAGNRPLFSNALSNAVFTPGGATNLAGGVIFGRNEFTPHPGNPPGLKKSMIVLTDGIENRCLQDGGTTWFSLTGRDANDPPDGMARPDGTPQDTDPLPQPAGIRVFGIGLGNAGQIDSAALSDLSTATGAPYQGAADLTGRDFFLLEKYFTQIFMDSAGLAQIADPFFTINPGDEHRFEFDVFPADVNAMVVLYDEPGKRLPFFIVSPAGETLSGNSLPPGFDVRFRSTDTARFVEFFFPNREPDRYAGRWTVIVRHPGKVCAGPVSGGGGKDEQRGEVGPGFTPEKCRGSRQPVDYGISIAAGSNLQMQAFVEPGQKFIGDPIRLVADISEAGLPVRGATVKVRVETPFGQTYTLALHDDGVSQDGQADDGEYGGVFTNTFAAGTYRFFFQAEGVQAGKVPLAWVRSVERTKDVYDKRTPPPDGDGGGHGKGCDCGCSKRMVRLLEVQAALLRELGRRQSVAKEVS